LCGTNRNIEVFLTGDGKAMASMNFLEGKRSGSPCQQWGPAKGVGYATPQRINGVPFCRTARFQNTLYE
jgi:hypothetical protein